MTSPRVVGIGLLFGAIAVIGPSNPAAAGIEQGTCTGSGAFTEGVDGPFTIDASTAGDQVFIVPRSDSVFWKGSVGGPPGIYSGSISVELPPPFGSVSIDSWSGDSPATSNEGVEEYDLGSLVPAGVVFRVEGTHTDANGVCSGYVKIEVDGGPFDSPVAPIGLALTGLAGAGFVASILPLFRRVV